MKENTPHRPLGDFEVIFGREYLVPTRWPRWILYFFALADVLLSRQPSDKPVERCKRLIVSKVDHLGDLMMITSVLCDLRKERRAEQIVLICSSDTVELARMMQRDGLVDSYMAVESFWLGRSKRTLGKLARAMKTQFAAIRRARRFGADCFLELRPFSPNANWIGLASGAPRRVGFGCRDFGWCLTHRIPISGAQSWCEALTRALVPFGVRDAACGPLWPRRDWSSDIQLKMPGRYVVVQVRSARAEKNPSLADWSEVLKGVCEPVVFVGAVSDAAIVDALVPRLGGGRETKNLCGKTTMQELFAVVAGAQSAISPDSFVAHVALALGVPCRVLYTQWWDPKAWYPTGRDNLSFQCVNGAGRL